MAKTLERGNTIIVNKIGVNTHKDRGEYKRFIGKRGLSCPPVQVRQSKRRLKMNPMNWKDEVKSLMDEINGTMEVIAEIRDAIQSWGMTKKQADKICLTFFQSALEKPKGKEV